MMNKKVVWINGNKLQQYVDIPKDRIVTYLTAFQKVAGVRAVHITKQGVLLNKKYLPIFADQFGLTCFGLVPEKGEQWDSIADLCSVLHKNIGAVSGALREHKDDADMCDEHGNKLIQFRRTAKDRYISLCLFKSDDARYKLAEKMGWSYTPPMHNYKMQYNWTNRRRFSDNEIHEAIMRLLKKGDVYLSEYECADALLSELPKHQGFEPVRPVEIPEQSVARDVLIHKLRGHCM